MINENIFSIQEEFFIIDSEELDQVKTKLYGFAFINNTLVENIDTLREQDPKGNGAYVCVRKDSQQITINQDFIGSYGLYLYKDHEYFALSNSFIALLNHVKKSNKITFNKDFANYMIASDLCSASYSQTMVKEIELIDRCAIIHIDIKTKQLNISYVDYGENTVELNSREGMEILDTWYNKWTSLIHNLYKENSNIQIDLSGGFDTRMILTLFLGSGIDMNKILVNSVNDNLHTHAEDYEIASAISKHYEFALNNSTVLQRSSVNYSLDDSINISFYLKLGFHKQMYPRIRRYNNLLHYFGGSGGECIRNYWNTTEEEYIKGAVSRCKIFSSDMTEELAQSTRNILSESFKNIRQKFENYGRSIVPENMTLNLYRETRCRNHFGKDIIENYYGGSVKYAPLLDPDLQKLKLNDSSCHDKNLLMAVMLDRYNSDLLNFKFDSNRYINKKTIKYAKSLNNKFPYIASTNKQSSTEKLQTSSPIISISKNKNRAITMNEYNESIQNIFYSSKNRRTFEFLYGEKLFESIAKDIRTRKHQPLQNAYTAISITKVFQDVFTNENIRCSSISEFYQNSTISSRSKLNDSLLKDPYLENYVTLRLDIKNIGAFGNDIEILNISDTYAKISKPEWMAKMGNGCVIESIKGRIVLTVRCIHAGNLSITLRGKDVKNNNNQRIPFWINLQSVSVNSKSQIDSPRPIWHDVPFQMSRKVTDKEEVHLIIEWGPYNTFADECIEDTIIAKENNLENQNFIQKMKSFIRRLLKHLVISNN